MGWAGVSSDWGLTGMYNLIQNAKAYAFEGISERRHEKRRWRSRLGVGISAAVASLH